MEEILKKLLSGDRTQEVIYDSFLSLCLLKSLRKRIPFSFVLPLRKAVSPGYRLRSEVNYARG